MPLSAGSRLGAYEIVSAIGAGGMGEVYRARDARLQRDVALKILPPSVATDPDRLRRFEQEGRAAAMLNHPNILVVHDVGTQEGLSYVISELLEGETLRTRLARGALPPLKVSEWGGQVARGLAAAHAKGLVHRDLKPDNLFLTRDGHVKILDFGLAKATGGAPAGDATHAATRALVTEPGVVLGTVAYMAPEQVRGLAVDQRADLFAFGAVLFEMLTGAAIFARATPADTTMAILNEDAPTEIAGRGPVAAALERIARRCLEKRPEDRFQSASDLAFALDGVASLTTPTHAVVDSRPRRTLSMLAAVAVALLVGMLATWALMRSSPMPSPPRVQRTTIALPPDDSLALEYSSIAVSDDGGHVAYVANHAGTRQIFLRAVNSFDAKPLAGTEGALMPFFSPDGRSLAFFANGKLLKISIDGGAPVALCDAPEPRGGDWGAGDVIVFAPGAETGLSQVSAAGGPPRAVTTLDGGKGERSHRGPQLLPGATAVLFTVVSGSGGQDRSIGVQSLVTGQRRTIVDQGESARYGSGWLVYWLGGGGAMARPFDVGRLEVTGPAVPVNEHLATSYVAGLWQFALSDDGSLAFISGGAPVANQRLPTWVDRRGVSTPLSAVPRAYSYLRLSPDGRRLVIGTEVPPDVWIYELTRDAFTKLTAGDAGGGVWNPDGARLAVGSRQTGVMSIFVRSADGNGAPELVLKDGLPESWSPDGRTLSLARGDPGQDILALQLEARTTQVVVKAQGYQFGSRISPDGRWLAYTSNESGEFEVYVTRFPSGAGRWPVSSGGGMQAVWARSGREIFYRSGDRMMAVAVETRNGFAAAKPTTLFEGRYYRGLAGGWSYDVSVDGERFAMIRTAAEDVAVKQVNLVTGWAAELTHTRSGR